jgi:MFS family permease
MERFLDFQFKKETKLFPVFLNQSLRSVAVSLLSLFSSIYIYKTFLSLTNQTSLALLAVFIYFLGLYVTRFISNLFAEELSLRVGLKKQIYLGLLFLIYCLLIFLLSLKWPLIVFLASPVWGLATGFYWFGLHGLMVKVGHNGAFGKEIGMAGLISTLFLLVVPVLGGVLINFAGYKALFIASLLFVVLSMLSIKKVEERRTNHDTDLNEVLGLFKTHKRMVLAYIGDSIAAAVYVIIIPLYLFLILKKELALGEFFSLSMILVALLNLFIGRWSDIKSKRKLVAYGSVFQALVWLSRIFTQKIGFLFVLDIVDRITDGMVGIPMNVMTYQKAIDGRSTGRAVLFREIAITIGSITACLLFIVLAVLKVELRFYFLIPVLSSFLPLLIVKRPSEKKI